MIINTGAGSNFFGGADGADLGASGPPGEFADAAIQLFSFFAESTRAIIAAVNGDAPAGGFGFVGSADIVATGAPCWEL